MFWQLFGRQPIMELLECCSMPPYISSLKARSFTAATCKNILCQCEAGVSRSAGCAAAIIKWLEGEDEAVFASDLYSPNRHVYRLMLRVIRKQSKSQRPG